MIRRLLPALAAAALVACGDKATNTADAELQRDLELAGQVQQPQVVFQDTALGAAPDSAPAEPRYTPAPAPAAREPEPRRAEAPRRPPTTTVRRPAPRPTAPQPEPTREPAREPVREEASAPAPAPGPARGSIGAGSGLALAISSRVCTVSNRPGDKVTATLNAPVQGANGAVIPAGSTVVLEVAEVVPGDPVEQSRVRFRVRSIEIGGETYTPAGGGATTGDATKVDYGRSKEADRKKVIGGAIAGAIAGQILGRDTKSTVIGAAAGAAAGTAAAKMGGRSEGCFDAGAPVRVTLEETLVMRG